MATQWRRHLPWKRLATAAVALLLLSAAALLWILNTEHRIQGDWSNILPVIFLGIEGKYIVTDKAEFNVFSPHLSGYTITSNFGFRF